MTDTILMKEQIPSAFRFGGIPSGIKDSGLPDLALITSDALCTAAGVFTQNRVIAAPVQLCRQRLPSSEIRGIVTCSGNANACTGEQGLRDAYRMAQVAAEEIGCRAEQVLVCSTGVIGVHLPMEKVEYGIRSLSKELGTSADHWNGAAQAILTTDTRTKVSTRSIKVNGGTINVAGMAKGAAMIGPNMATLLAFVMTDACVAPDALNTIVKEAADQSFNCISVEGHTSTNDTLLLLANGKGEQLGGSDLTSFREAVIAVCSDLSREIIADAEGAEHLVRIRVDGLRTDDEAHRIAKTVAESALVKAAIFGGDPNWGRIVSAAGYAGVDFEERDCSLLLNDVLLYERGSPQEFDAAKLSAKMKANRDVDLRLLFTLGNGECTFWTSDLTYEYVRLNAEYTT